MASIGPYCAWFSGGAHFGEFAIGDTSGKPLCKSKSTFSKKEFIDMEFTMMCGKTTLTIGGVPGVSAETSPSMESDQITVWAINGVVAIKRIEVKELNELPAAQTSSPSTVTPAVAVPLPALQSGQRWTNSLGMIFVPVPGTAVQFAIWDTRVTDFTAFIQATGYDATQGMGSLGKDGWNGRGDSWKSPGFAQGPTHPVCGVSWEDAKAFCEWLTKKERNTGQLQQGQLYRLPTDAEWSVAVGLEEEAGSTPDEKSARSRGAYPWGTQWPPPRGAGNYAGEESKTGAPADWPVISDFDDRFARTSPVGSFSANLFGLYDMGGNVWQLCEDFYKLDQQWRVFRGASWDTNDPDNMRSSFRGWAPPGVRAGAIGFRCVLAGGGVSTAR
jgi:formylglycine-generating enzyme required for sulfatase activity